jgi:hypothetical protein
MQNPPLIPLYERGTSYQLRVEGKGEGKKKGKKMMKRGWRVGKDKKE